VRVVRYQGRSVDILMHEDDDNGRSRFIVNTMHLLEPPSFASIHDAIEFADHYLKTMSTS
jgi:hypothetical protein